MEKQRETGKSVLLFSGGLDSVCLAHLLHPDVLLHIDSSGKYAAQETKAIEQLCVEGAIPRGNLVNLTGVLDLKLFERPDLIVPNRNAYFVLTAAQYGETIYLGVVLLEKERDKDSKFCTLMTQLLNHMQAESAWCAGREFLVAMPAVKKTKSQLVGEFLAAGGAPQALLTSYSCYTGNDGPCGNCKTCFKKWVALVNNKVEIPNDYFAQHPTEWNGLEEALPLIKQYRYRGKTRDLEVLKALRAA